MELGGVGALPAPFFTEGRTRGDFRRSVAGNPGSVGMTKGRVALPFRFDTSDDEQQVPPLRFASVGMTLLFLPVFHLPRSAAGLWFLWFAVSFRQGFEVEATRNRVWVMRMAARTEPLSEPATLLSPPDRLR